MPFRGTGFFHYAACGQLHYENEIWCWLIEKADLRQEKGLLYIFINGLREESWRNLPEFYFTKCILIISFLCRQNTTFLDMTGICIII